MDLICWRLLSHVHILRALGISLWEAQELSAAAHWLPRHTNADAAKQRPLAYCHWTLFVRPLVIQNLVYPAKVKILLTLKGLWSFLVLNCGQILLMILSYLIFYIRFLSNASYQNWNLILWTWHFVHSFSKLKLIAFKICPTIPLSFPCIVATWWLNLRFFLFVKL